MEVWYPLEEENAENDNSKCHENAPIEELPRSVAEDDLKALRRVCSPLSSLPSIADLFIRLLSPSGHLEKQPFSISKQPIFLQNPIFPS